MAYCTVNNISQKQRLAELGISEWQFYSSKRKYAPRREGDNAGEFLQLVPGGAFLTDPIKPARSRSVRQKEADRGAVSVSVELRTPGGTVMRISGDLTGRELRDIIEASSSLFSLGEGMRYWLYSEPTDMRKSFHTLSGLVRNRIGDDRAALRELLPDRWEKVSSK